MRKLAMTMALVMTVTRSLSAQPPETAVAVIDGRPLMQGEFEVMVADPLLRLRTDVYAMEIVLLNEEIDNRLLAEEAKSRHLTVSELIQQEVAGKVPPVSEAEARAILETSAPKGPIGEQAIKTAMTDLGRRRASALRADFLASLRQRHSVQIMLPQPKARRNILVGESVGPADAPVSIVEFSDFQCPFCGPLSAVLDQIRSTYGSKIKLIYKHFPLPSHIQAEHAAEAAVCASKQGRFWEMHDRLFSEQLLVASAAFSDIAAHAGLDVGSFNACMRTQASSNIVARDFADGLALGITATPTLLINGKLFAGARSVDALRELIDAELALTSVHE